MGELRDEWYAAKKKLDKAKVDTGRLYTEDLGSKLDKFEAALSKFDKARGTYRLASPEMVKLRAALKKAYDRVARTCLEYEATTTHLADHAADAQQKAAFKTTAAALLKLIHQIGHARQFT